MNDIISGPFKIVFCADGSDTDALYGFGEPTNRWIINIWFKDPESLYMNFDNSDGEWLIKSKMLDGDKDKAKAWAQSYLKSIVNIKEVV